MIKILVFTIDGYQKCNYCEIYADDGGLINEKFACHDCLENQEGENEMKIYSYKNFEIKDDVFDLDLQLYDYEEMLNKYENVKYSDVDFNIRPTREKLEKEFLNLVVYDMEEEIKNDNDYIYIEVENRDRNVFQSMKLNFKIINKVQGYIKIDVFLDK